MRGGSRGGFIFSKSGANAAERVASKHGGNLDPYLSPEAWYVLTNTDGLTDQSGNAHTLGGSQGQFIRGKNLGMVCSYNVGLLEAAPKPVWRTAGAVSCVSMVNINSSAGDRWFASCETNAQAWATWWKFGVGSDGRACYGVNNGSASEYFQWGPVLPVSGWHTFGWSRAADGRTVRVYLDGKIAGEGVASMAPNGGSAAQLSIGKDYFQPVQAYRQQLSALWVRELSAREMDALSQRIQGDT